MEGAILYSLPNVIIIIKITICSIAKTTNKKDKYWWKKQIKNERHATNKLRKRYQKYGDIRAEIRQMLQQPSATECDTTINEMEITKSLNIMKNIKATARNGLWKEVLQIVLESKPEILKKLYNRCPRECKFPTIWKRADMLWLKIIGKRIRHFRFGINRVVNRIRDNKKTHTCGHTRYKKRL